MNLCSCCYDEAAGIWCGCEYEHDQDGSVIQDARDYMHSPREMKECEGWSYYCAACSRYTSGTAYYFDN